MRAIGVASVWRLMVGLILEISIVRPVNLPEDFLSALSSTFLYPPRPALFDKSPKYVSRWHCQILRLQYPPYNEAGGHETRADTQDNVPGHLTERGVAGAVIKLQPRQRYGTGYTAYEGKQLKPRTIFRVYTPNGFAIAVVTDPARIISS